MTDPIHKKLREPITIFAGEKNERVFTEVTVRTTVLVRDLAARDAVDGEVRKQAALMASLADVPIFVFYEMDAADFLELNREVAAITNPKLENVVAE